MPQSQDKKRNRESFRKRSAVLGKKVSADIFNATRWKIVALYLSMGFIVLVGAEYILYPHILAVVQNVFESARILLQGQTTINQNIIQNLILQAIWTEIVKINFVFVIVGLLVLVTLAYLFSKATMEPMHRIQENQKRFASHVSHELRTPLSIMKMNTEVALLGTTSPSKEELIEILRVSVEEVERMTDVIDFFVSSATREDRQNKLEFSKVDLAEIAQKTVKETMVKAVKKEVSLKIVADKPAFILGNKILLEGMMVNLLKNAIAYTSAGGMVSASVLSEGNKATFAVQDTGIGIPPKDLPKIFDAFYRGENAFSQRTKRQGSGIGLTIVKEITDLHRATISVKSELGKGTIISVMFHMADK